MLRCEIIRTCSHEKVAEAAVLSIGPGFRDRVALVAAASGMGAGACVAGFVRRFQEEASQRDMDALANFIAGSDMPILDGLRWIVEFMIDGSGGSGSEDPRFRRLRGGARAVDDGWSAQAARSIITH